MTLRAVLGFALSVLAAVIASPPQVRASTVAIDLSITYDQTAPGPLDGKAQFSLAGVSAAVLGPLSDPITIGPLSPGQNFSIVLFPPTPCFGLTSCQINFSFGGTAGGFGAFAFAQFSDALNFIPPGPNNIPIAIFEPPDPCINGAICQASGPIVAYDAPVVVGTWEVTISETPLPAALPLFATGLGALGLFGWRRKRKAQAAT
jgi:hypothetical protein